MHSKGNYEQNKKTTHRLESVFKQLGIVLQNIEIAKEVLYQKTTQPNQKVGRKPKKTFLQRHTDG